MDRNGLSRPRTTQPHRSRCRDVHAPHPPPEKYAFLLKIVPIRLNLATNKYEFLDGTSMASPVMAGVVALIRSYYPKLSAKQVKQAVMENGSTSTTKLIKPGTEEKVLLSELCKSGSYVNALKAVEAASKMKGTQTFTGSPVKSTASNTTAKPKA